jgi:hypothetical protein
LLDKYDFAVKDAAEDIGCHPETLRRYCRKYKIALPKGRKGHKPELRKQTSKLKKWLDEYEGEVPSSYRDIADLAHLSYKTVYMYYYNRKKEAKRVLLQRPWTGGDKNIILKTEDGARVPVGSVAKVKAYVQRTTGDIRLDLQTHSGQKFVCWYDPRVLKKLFME